MKLTKEKLLEVFTQQQIDKSTYITPRGYKHIRLINNKPSKALVPALYPNLTKYRQALLKYENVIDRRIETKNGIRTGNQKIDVNLGLPDNLPDLPDSKLEN